MNQSTEMVEIRNVLRQKNVKITLPRITIFQVLRKATEGMSAYDVENYLIKHNNRINLATIYSTLKLFHDVGLLQRYKTDQDHTLYLMNNAETFIRLECKSCGFTTFTQDAILEQKIKDFYAQKQLNVVNYDLVIQIENCEKCPTC